MESFVTAIPAVPRRVEARGVLLGGKARALGAEAAPIAGGAPGGVPGWRAEPAALHVLVDAGRLPEVPGGAVRMLAPGELDGIRDMTAALREELALVMREGTPVAAALHEERPVAFCYAGSVTEAWWDVSIDTLAPYRRQGYAARCATYMIRRMAEAGKRPVWGSAVSNPPSALLATRLGFVAVDALVVFSQGDDSQRG